MSTCDCLIRYMLPHNTCCMQITCQCMTNVYHGHAEITWKYLRYEQHFHSLFKSFHTSNQAVWILPRLPEMHAAILDLCMLLQLWQPGFKLPHSFCTSWLIILSTSYRYQEYCIDTYTFPSHEATFTRQNNK